MAKGLTRTGLETHPNCEDIQKGDDYAENEHTPTEGECLRQEKTRRDIFRTELTESRPLWPRPDEQWLKEWCLLVEWEKTPLEVGEGEGQVQKSATSDTGGVAGAPGSSSQGVYAISSGLYMIQHPKRSRRVKETSSYPTIRKSSKRGAWARAETYVGKLRIVGSNLSDHLGRRIPANAGDGCKRNSLVVFAPREYKKTPHFQQYPKRQNRVSPSKVRTNNDIKQSSLTPLLLRHVRWVITRGWRAGRWVVRVLVVNGGWRGGRRIVWSRLRGSVIIGGHVAGGIRAIVGIWRSRVRASTRAKEQRDAHGGAA